MLIAVFVLALSEKDEDFKKILKQVLSFYRENRELLQALSKCGEDDGRTENGKTQKAPPDAGESLRILDEFLKTV